MSQKPSRQMSDELWIACGSKLTGKLALREYLTGVMPGLETPVHFAETAADYYVDNSGARRA